MQRLRSCAAAFFSIILVILTAELPATSARAGDDTKRDEPREAKTLREAGEVLTVAVSVPDKGIPKELLERAECVGVFPGLKKGAFIVGGEFGRGVFTCRGKDGKMGAPAFFTMVGASVGWQFGGEEADVVLLVMNDVGMKKLLQDHVTLGGEVSVAAGPVGRSAEAKTDLQLHAQMLSWSRSRGLFVGASLEGTVLMQDRKSAEEVYGESVSANDILLAQKVDVPAMARMFVKTATEHTRRES